jgi:hypothetical protein
LNLLWQLEPGAPWAVRQDAASIHGLDIQETGVRFDENRLRENKGLPKKTPLTSLEESAA